VDAQVIWILIGIWIWKWIWIINHK
jgi:hypothetical protein